MFPTVCFLLPLCLCDPVFDRPLVIALRYLHLIESAFPPSHHSVCVLSSPFHGILDHPLFRGAQGRLLVGEFTRSLTLTGIPPLSLLLRTPRTSPSQIELGYSNALAHVLESAPADGPSPHTPPAGHVQRVTYVCMKANPFYYFVSLIVLSNRQFSPLVAFTLSQLLYD